MTEASNWPPSYRLRYSNRARHVNLRICPRNGLEIITPPRFNFNEIPMLLEKHRRWIERTYHRLKPSLTRIDEPEIPSQILFSSLHPTSEHMLN